jgi:hypothetical protein
MRKKAPAPRKVNKVSGMALPARATPMKEHYWPDSDASTLKEAEKIRAHPARHSAALKRLEAETKAANAALRKK